MSEILEIQKTELKIIVRDVVTGSVKQMYNLDLKENVTINVVKNIIDIQNIQKRYSDFSYDILLPGTDNNNKIFANFFDVKHYVQNDTLENGKRVNFNGDFNSTMITECQLYINGVNTLNGTLELRSIYSTEDYNINYSAIIIGSNVTLFKKISGKYLNDLGNIIDKTGLSAQLHKYTSGNVFPSTVNKFDDKCYTYALIDTGQSKAATFPGNNNWTNLKVKDFTFCFKIKTIIDLIFIENGFTYESKFFNDEYMIKQYFETSGVDEYPFKFSKLVIPNNNGMKMTNEDDIKDLSFISDGESESINIITVNLRFPIKNDNYKHTGLPATFGLFNPSGYTNGNAVQSFKAFSDAQYSFICKFKFNVDYFSTLVSITDERTNVVARIRRFRPSTGEDVILAQTQYFVGSPIGITLPNYITEDISVQMQTPVTDIRNGDLVYTEMQLVPLDLNGTNSTTYPGVGETFTLNYIGQERGFYGIATGNIIEDGTISIKSMLPNNIKQDEFLISIINMFNLYIEPGTNPNSFIIEPREEFLYNNGLKNMILTDKVDRNKEIIIEPTSAISDKNYIYKFKDDNDLYNKDYSEKNNKKIYGTRKIEIENDIIKNEKIIETKNSPCIPIGSPNSILYLPSYSMNENPNVGVIASIIYDNQNNNSNFRVLCFDILTTGGLYANRPFAYRLYDIDNNFLYTSQYYPAAVSLMIDRNYLFNDSLLFDLNFGRPDFIYSATLNKYPTNNLYNEFHKNGIAENSDKNSKLVTFYLDLSQLELNEINFRRTYIIDNQYYKLYKLEYNNIKNNTTKVTFYKGIKFEKFVGSYIELTSTLENINIGGGIDGIVGKISNSNILPNTNATLDYGNNINSIKSYGIVANGNNNDIDSTNITILGSDNNYIKYKNTTIIGTENYINEFENETVINNIQFPFTKEIIIEHTDISNLHTTPYLLLEVPSGYYFEINEAFVKYYYETHDFSDRDLIIIDKISESHLLTATHIFGTGANNMVKFLNTNGKMTNEDIYLKASADTDGAAATGYIKVIITYRIFKF